MNSNCSYFCMFCQAVGQIVIDQNSTHKVCSLQSHQEIQKSTIKCKHCNSTANSINYYQNLNNKLPSPSNTSIFCDEKCCLCNNLGTTYINQTQYHKICCFIFHKSIFATSSIYCIHCTSSISLSENYFQPPFIDINVFLFKFESHPRNFNLPEEINYIKNIAFNELDSQNNKCLNVQNYDSLSGQNIKIPNAEIINIQDDEENSSDLDMCPDEEIIYTKNRAFNEPDSQNNKCLNVRNYDSLSGQNIKIPNAEIINIQDDEENNSDYNISSEEEVKANEAYQTIIPHMCSENEKSKSLVSPFIEICYIHTVGFSVTRMYYIYSQSRELPCDSQRPTCELSAQNSYEFVGEIYIKLRDNEVWVRRERNICKSCFIEIKGKIEASKKICKNCREAYNFKGLKFSCGHKGCEFCYFDGDCCFKCWKNSKAPKEQECFKCMRRKFPVQLFCGHHICKKCRKSKRIKRFNYCCIECCLSKMKVCLKCKKICQWEIDNDKKILHKKCCGEFYCSLCFDKRNSIIIEFIKCLCVKNPKIFNS